MPHYADREHVISLRKPELVRLLLRFPGCRDSKDEHHFLQFCRLVEAIFHYEFHTRLERIKELYAPFDPDCAYEFPLSQALAPAHGRLSDQARQVELLLNEIRYLLQRANFVRLERCVLEEAMQRTGRWGINFVVNLKLFEELELYARGNTLVLEKRPERFLGLIPEQGLEVPVYDRVVLIVRYKQDAKLPRFVDKRRLYVSMFKDVPRDDLELLVPGVRPRIQPWDVFKIGLPLSIGIPFFFWKLMVGAAFKLASGVVAMFNSLGTFMAPFSSGLRSYMGYLSTWQKYLITLLQCLLFQTLDNNLGAIIHLLDEAEEQEFREVVLSWFFLWRVAGPEGWEAASLDRAIEDYLCTYAHLHVDFEIEDALEKLLRFGLAQVDSQGRWQAVPLLEACQRLDEIWDGYFRYHNPLLS
ncbi:MAG: TMEM143 family protein [Gemmatales bacterium]|nr:TMEM143 family protein [Gemmatales bacterium]